MRRPLTAPHHTKKRAELEAAAMTAEAPESLVTEGVGSLEVRWIFPGQIETAVAECFGVSRPRPSHARTSTSWIRSCADCR